MKKSQRRNLQEDLALLLARLTVAKGRYLFVTDEALTHHLNLSKSGRSPTARVRQALQRLECKGLITRAGGRSSWSAQLTPAGKKLAEKIDKHHQALIHKPARWDGKWRVLMFDIWERRRDVRDKLRRALQGAGFCELQNSVWVYPYDCEDLLVFLRADLRLGSGIIYLIAEGVEGDANLRKHFELN
jgi:DNA-binding transcriptional regulator PaaX